MTKLAVALSTPTVTHADLAAKFLNAEKPIFLANFIQID
jgi:predicted dehydrogenase